MKFLKAYGVYLIILLPAIYFAVFLHLDSLPFRVWDEGYLAMHTYEMMGDHDYVVTHSFGAAEMSNTKPPLVIWCMVASSKLLGFSELSIRLPNAIAGTLICLMLFFFTARYLGSPLTGFLSVVILLSSNGFTTPHVVRTGEYDALLMFFTFVFCISFFMLLESSASVYRGRLWVLLTVALIGAVLTKGIAGVIGLPGLFIYALTQRKVLWLLRSRETYISIAAVLFFGLGYYFLREHFNPGYLQAVDDNELGGRYVKTNEGHEAGFIYYWELLRGQFLFVMPFILIGIYRAFISGMPTRMERMMIFILCFSLTLLLVLSTSATKLFWYDAPLVPFISLLAGFGFFTMFDYLLEIKESLMSTKKIPVVAFFVIILIMPSYGGIILDNLRTTEDPWDREAYSITHFIKRREEEGANMNGYKLVHDDYMLRAEMCQMKKLEYKGQKLEIVDMSALKEGDRVVTNDSYRQQIARSYEHETIDAFENVEVWRLILRKVKKTQ